MAMTLEQVRQRRKDVAKVDMKVRLDRDVAELLDDLAKRKSVSRGAIVERALDLYFRIGGLTGQKDA